MVHSVVIGLGFGDEGKGRIVDYLCATTDVKAVVRFSGGAQAAHNVVMPDGRQHTFSQFGSGTFHGVPTYLSEYMLVNPYNLMREYESLKTKLDFDPLEILYISSEATVITPYHREANRRRETARGADAHGSCGQGIGETQRLKLEGLVLTVGDLAFEATTEEILNQIEGRYIEEFGMDFSDNLPECDVVAENFRDIFDRIGHVDYIGDRLHDFLDEGDCVFEGSQGVLLDEWYGFHPYTTWSTTTAENALQILGERAAKVIGVTRSYLTRHGAGPFPSERVASMDEAYPELHNGIGVFQGAWRRGNLDLVLLRYATLCARVDEIAVTHLDRPLSWAITQYGEVSVLPSKDYYGYAREDLEYQSRITDYLDELTSMSSIMPASENELVEMISDVTATPVTIRAFGPTWESTNVLQLQ